MFSSKTHWLSYLTWTEFKTAFETIIFQPELIAQLCHPGLYLSEQNYTLPSWKTQSWENLPAMWLECSERRGLPAAPPEVVHQELRSHHQHVSIIKLYTSDNCLKNIYEIWHRFTVVQNSTQQMSSESESGCGGCFYRWPLRVRRSALRGVAGMGDEGTGG